MSPELDKLLASVWEICGGSPLSKGGKLLLASSLDAYPPEQVVEALNRCVRELRGKITIGEITARISDGRPGANEAWAELPHSEDASVVWTEEMSQAYGVSCGLDDRVAARMAFMETYTRLVSEARAAGKPPKWTYSPGFDESGREAALRKAVDLGRLTAGDARKLEPWIGLFPGEVEAQRLTDGMDPSEEVRRLTEGMEVK